MKDDRRNLALSYEAYRKLLIASRKAGKPMSRVIDELFGDVVTAPVQKN